jgi:hypothetical protein
MHIDKKLSEARVLINTLENENNDIDRQLEIIEELEEIIGENPSVIKYKSICLYNAGFIDDARAYLSDRIKRYEQSYDLFSLLFEVYRYSNEYETVFYALSRMYKLADSESARSDILKLLEDYVIDAKMPQDVFRRYFEIFKADIEALDYRAYPINEYRKSVIREDAFPNRDKGNSYLVNMYKSIQVTDVNESNRCFFLYEMIKGSFAEMKAVVSADKGDVIAVSSASKEPVFSNLIIHNLEDTPVSIRLEPNLVRYFKARKNSEIIIEADQNIFVSHFKNNRLTDKPRLVLQLFLDGLSFQFLADNGFERLMPNTYRFFKKGYINTNCHANSEWTLPSLMSMCTGKYTTSHYVYDTNAAHKGEVNNKFIQEYFEEAGYMTGRICPNWRGTPSYGYFKSTNRSVYSPLMDRMSCSEGITEAIEHLEAFKDFYNYTWLTIEDLHTVADGLARGPYPDLNSDRYFSEKSDKDSDISVFRSYNEKKIEEYKSVMKKVDFYLGILYTYIENNYKDNEFVITLNSDHGQRFIEKEDYMFTQKRTNVPFMMRGRGVVVKKSNELMSNVDVVPLLLHVCGLQNDSQVDGRLLCDFAGSGRSYTITESVFPGQTYKLAINDEEHLFMFESREEVRRDGTIPVDEYTVQLRNRRTGEDETDMYPEKVEYFCEEAFMHIREWIAASV